MKTVRSFTKAALIMTCAFVVAGILPCKALAQNGEGESPWLMRVRLLGVEPDDSSSDITVIGGKAGVDNSITADVDFSYFFTDNIAAELTLAVTEHDVEAKCTAAGDVDLGEVKLLPPTLTLQYHLMPDDEYRPYVGAGINYTVFFDDEPSPGSAATSAEYDNEFGFALQAGIDIEINEQLALNIDLKKIFLDTDVTVRAAGTKVKTNVDIDPWLIGVGLAYRF